MRKLLNKLSFARLFLVFFYIFIFCLVLRSSFNYLDPDLGWHLKVGQEIIQTGALPNLNHFNYTFTGSWVDHEWLSNIWLYIMYSRFGYIFVSIFWALLIVAVLVILNIVVRRRYPQLGFIYIAFFQFIGLTASLPHLGVRVQEFGLLFLLLTLLIIGHYDKHGRKRILLFLPPLLYLWVCLHASFLIGLFLLAAYVMVKIAEALISRLYPRPWLKLPAGLNYQKIYVFAAAAAASFIVTLFTPYRLRLYSFLAGYQDAFYQAHIQEWLSQFSFPFQYWQLFYLSLVTLALIGYVYYSIGRIKYFKIDLWTLFVVVLFIALSFKSRRHFPLMFVATFVFVVEVYRLALSDIASAWRRPVSHWIKFCLILCLMLLAISEASQTNFTAQPFAAYCSDYPCGAVNFLKSHPRYDSWHIFNNYVWGGFLIWTDPSRLLFIDGRLPQVPFNGHSFLEEYLDFFKKNTDWPQKFSQYQIKLILLPTKDQKLSAQNWEKVVFGISAADLKDVNYLRAYLLTAPNWRVIYSDKTATIYAQE